MILNGLAAYESLMKWHKYLVAPREFRYNALCAVWVRLTSVLYLSSGKTESEVSAFAPGREIHAGLRTARNGPLESSPRATSTSRGMARDEAETLRAQLDYREPEKELRPMGKAIVELLHDRLPDRKPGARQNG
jgi:hypothetical protein